MEQEKINYHYFDDNIEADTINNLVEKLDEINKHYRNSIEDYFKKENEKRDSCEHDFEIVYNFTDMSYLCKKCGYEKYSI